MLALDGSHIYGNPSLHAHGFYRYVDDGVAFDGTDTFMTAKLPKTDVLINPDASPSGFSFATKIKFGREAMEYEEARYILDSGGHHSGKRGVSLYVNNGYLYAEVQTMDKLWKVQIK